jgi:hypothetical protein
LTHDENEYLNQIDYLNQIFSLEELMDLGLELVKEMKEHWENTGNL